MNDPAAPAFDIRPINPDDYARAAAVVRAACEAGPYRDELAQNAARAAIDHDGAGRNSAGQVLVAGAAGTLIGAVTVLRGGSGQAEHAGVGEAELSLLAVTPDARGSDVGEALTRAGVELALRWGSTALRLSTSATSRATEIAERLGFESVTRLSGGPGGMRQETSLCYVYPLQGRTDVLLREIRANEIAEISELVLAAYRDDYAGLPDTYLAEIANVAERAAQHQVWVAEETATGELLGTVTTPRPGELLSDVARAGEMDLRLLGVAAPARGRGVGSHIMRHCLRLAKIRGNSRVVLNTSTEMVAAYELYERMGFARIPERERDIERQDGTSFRLLAYGIDVTTA